MKHLFTAVFIILAITQALAQTKWGCGCMISTGIYAPIGNKHIIPPGPVYGFSFATPIDDGLSGELGFKFRVPRESKPFLYHAMGKDTATTSDLSVFFGATLSHSIYERKSNMIRMRYGLGADFVSLTLEDRSNPDDVKGFKITTLHGVYGFSVIHQFNHKRFIGLMTELHFVPYGLSSRLKTKFDVLALSTELFFRF